MKDIIINSLIGFAVGDAFGVPVEFCEREYVKSLNLNAMITGTHNVEKGVWSDDTSMLVATMDSIINNNGKINYKDIMDSFITMVDKGTFTSTGQAFDVGTTITKSLNRYKETKDELNSGCVNFMDNGNGALMRILPISLYCILNKLSNEDTKIFIDKASSLTHAHEISKLGCYIYTMYLKEIIASKNKTEAFKYIISYDYKQFSKESFNAYKRLLNEEFLNIKEENIKSTGFIVDTLESVIYSVNSSSDYKEAILTSVNLGLDTDTICALTGALAGILYGINDIPANWLNDLVKKEYLIDYANRYCNVLIKMNNEKDNIRNM